MIRNRLFKVIQQRTISVSLGRRTLGSSAFEAVKSKGDSVLINDPDVLIHMRDCSVRPHLPHNSYALKGPPVAVQGLSWTLRKGENWVCIGPNGCGKSTFVRSLVGKATILKGEFWSKIQSSACVSFADHERLKALTEYMTSHGANLEEEGLTVGSLMRNSLFENGSDHRVRGDIEELVKDFCDYRHLWKRNLDSLSSGELRRVLILHALFGRRDQVELLILDEAFDFIDDRRRDLLSQLLNIVAEQNPETRILLVSHRDQDLGKLTFLTNRLQFPGRQAVGEGGESGQVAVSSKVDSALASFNRTSINERNAYLKMVRTLVQRSLDYRRRLGEGTVERNMKRSPVVEIRNATLAYGEDESPVLKNATLVLQKGERVLLCGPSGSGKSLLLSLISGDNPQCYSNDVRVFGRRLGSGGDSLESRRSMIGMFSPSMSQSRFLYNREKTALDVVSTGILPNAYDIEERLILARQWADLFLKAIGSSADQKYSTLSQGQRTVALLARAFAGSPKLLILDEPFTSLDVNTRERLKDIIQCLLQCDPECTVVATSHYPMEDFPYFDQKLMLVRSSFQDTFHLSRFKATPASSI